MSIRNVPTEHFCIVVVVVVDDDVVVQLVEIQTRLRQCPQRLVESTIPRRDVGPRWCYAAMAVVVEIWRTDCTGRQRPSQPYVHRSRLQQRHIRRPSWSRARPALFDPLIPQSNWPLYSNTVIGTLAVDGWAVTFGTARRGLGGLCPAQSPPICTKCNNHPSTASVPTSYYSMWHHNCLWILKR